MEFGSIIGTFGAMLVLNILLTILSWVMTPLGAAGSLIISCLRIGLGLYGVGIALNWWSSILGLRGSCSQGYWTPWPPAFGSAYRRDPVTGLRQDEPLAPLFG